MSWICKEFRWNKSRNLHTSDIEIWVTCFTRHMLLSWTALPIAIHSKNQRQSFSVNRNMSDRLSYGGKREPSSSIDDWVIGRRKLHKKCGSNRWQSISLWDPKAWMVEASRNMQSPSINPLSKESITNSCQTQSFWHHEKLITLQRLTEISLCRKGWI